MTRINVIPASELSDQHLIAEYHELPRVLLQDVNTNDAPDKYCLGRGHVKWGKNHARFVFNRLVDLIIEMKYRGFKPNYDTEDLLEVLPDCAEDYHPQPEDVELNRQRLREKFQMKPNWYRWTKRTKPDWLNQRRKNDRANQM